MKNFFLSWDNFDMLTVKSIHLISFFSLVKVVEMTATAQTVECNFRSKYQIHMENKNETVRQIKDKYTELKMSEIFNLSCLTYKTKSCG